MRYLSPQSVIPAVTLEGRDYRLLFRKEQDFQVSPDQPSSQLPGNETPVHDVELILPRFRASLYKRCPPITLLAANLKMAARMYRAHMVQILCDLSF